MSESEKWEQKLSEMFQPLFHSGIEEIQASLDAISSNTEKASTIGTFLLRHLVLEKYIEDLLAKELPDLVKIDGHKVSFAKKLEIVNKLKILSNETYRAICAINEIRNGLAHKLESSEVKDSHKAAILCVIDRWDKDGELRRAIEGQPTFYPAIAACTYLILVELLTKISLAVVQHDVEREFIRQKDLMFKEILGEITDN